MSCKTNTDSDGNETKCLCGSAPVRTAGTWHKKRLVNSQVLWVCTLQSWGLLILPPCSEEGEMVPSLPGVMNMCTECPSRSSRVDLGVCCCWEGNRKAWAGCPQDVTLCCAPLVCCHSGRVLRRVLMPEPGGCAAEPSGKACRSQIPALQLHPRADLDEWETR